MFSLKNIIQAHITLNVCGDTTVSDLLFFLNEEEQAVQFHSCMECFATRNARVHLSSYSHNFTNLPENLGVCLVTLAIKGTLDNFTTHTSDYPCLIKAVSEIYDMMLVYMYLQLSHDVTTGCVNLNGAHEELGGSVDPFLFFFQIDKILCIIYFTDSAV